MFLNSSTLDYGRQYGPNQILRQEIRPAAIPKLLLVQIFLNPLLHVAKPRNNCTIATGFNGLRGNMLVCGDKKSGRAMNLPAPT